MNEFQKAQNAKILSCYNTDETLSDLQKAEILDIEKGGKRALIGEKRTFGGREYIKTTDGWKFHGKGTGTKAQEHAAGSRGPSERSESNDGMDSEFEARMDDPEYREKIERERELKFRPEDLMAEEFHGDIIADHKDGKYLIGKDWVNEDVVLKELNPEYLQRKLSSKPTETPKTEKVAEEKKLDIESIPTSEDGLYQIYTTKIKDTNTGSIREMYVVPSAANKGLKGSGSDLFDTLEEAIQTAKENRIEQKEDEKREAQRIEEKKTEEAAKDAKKEANKGKTAAQIMQDTKKEKVWNDWKLDIETRMKAGYKPEVAEVFDSAATNKRQERYDYLRKYAPFGNPKHPQTIEMQQLKEDIANGSIKKKETRLVHPDGRFFKIPQSVYDRLIK